MFLLGNKKIKFSLRTRNLSPGTIGMLNPTQVWIYKIFEHKIVNIFLPININIYVLGSQKNSSLK